MDTPETRYARSGDVHIAYQILGDGPVDILFSTGVPLPVDCLWDAPEPARFFQRLATFSRVILFDRRGVGLSDPISAETPPTLEQWVDDALTVLDDLRCPRVVLLGSDIHGGQVCMLLAATHPRRVSAAIIVNSAATLKGSADHNFARSGLPAPIGGANRAEWLASAETFSLLAPSLAVDPRRKEWWRRSILRGVSPGVAAAMVDVRDGTDVRPVLSTIRVPTLVLSRVGNRAYPAAYSRYIAQHIPSTRLVELEGDDQLIFAGDQATLLGEIEEFVTGARPAAEPDRVLATVLFTDIVRSTETAIKVGDREWHVVLDRHDAIIDAELERFGGRRIHGLGQGDGVLATFDGPARAVRCAKSVISEVRELGLDVRCGLHTGEIERRGDDVGGIAVHIAARVMAHAGSGEVLVSRTLTDLVAGSGLIFDDRGEHELKGVPGSWRLYAAAGPTIQPALDQDRRETESSTKPTVRSEQLSHRELEVLRLIAAGGTTRDIAADLAISEHTVARHVQNMFTKLGVTSRAAAVSVAHEYRLL